MKEVIEKNEQMGNISNSSIKDGRKSKILEYIKFLFLPFWRDPVLSAQEFELEKLKSKRRFFKRFLTPLNILGLLFILFIMVLAVYPVWLTPYTHEELSFSAPDLGSYKPPSSIHPLGQIRYGYDLLGRLIWGARSAVTVGLLAIVIAVGGGVTLGLIASYSGGKIDTIIMRIIDIFIAFPSLILAMIFISILGYDIQYTMIAFGILGIPGYARFTRSSVLQVKNRLFIDAARVGGSDNFRIMFKHLLPNAISPIIIQISGSFAGVVMGLSSLSFLGLGDNSIIDWGSDINAARSNFQFTPEFALWPGLFIGITVFGFMLLGDGLRDTLDPKQSK